MERYRQIYWSYTYDRNAVRVVEPNMTLCLDKNGCLPNGNNYIYLFFKYISYFCDIKLVFSFEKEFPRANYYF